jgi:uncharacterized ion transporter superfamily protein YfcC
MQHLILLAVVSVMVLYVLIIACCLCYVGRYGRRTSKSPRSYVMTERALREVNTYEHSFKSPACLCVFDHGITAFDSRRRTE